MKTVFIICSADLDKKILVIQFSPCRIFMPDIITSSVRPDSFLVKTECCIKHTLIWCLLRCVTNHCPYFSLSAVIITFMISTESRTEHIIIDVNGFL